MTESLLLLCLAGRRVCVVGRIATTLLVRAMNMPTEIRISSDWRFVAGGPRWPSSRVRLRPAASRSDGTPRSQNGRPCACGRSGGHRCLLLISSAIIVRGAIRSASIDIAFDYHKMLVVNLQLYADRLTRRSPPKAGRIARAISRGYPASIV